MFGDETHNVLKKKLENDPFFSQHEEVRDYLIQQSRVIGNMMNFDFLYSQKTIEIMRGNTVLFEVTVTEISHDAKAKLQAARFKNVDMSVESTNKKQMQREISRRVSQAMKTMDATEIADRETLLGVKSWTLQCDGKPVDVTYEDFRSLPIWITKQIEQAVEELNPEVEDSEFQDES
jgi:hypothetical protein